jgi:hypothetical protein
LRIFRVANYVGSSLEITPQTSVVLAGFANRLGGSTGVADALEANIIIIRDGETRAILVSVDTLYVGALRSRILESLSGQVESRELFIGASHTHFAPATDPALPKLGEVDEEFLAETVEKISGRICELLKQRGSDVSVEYACGLGQHSINRRKVLSSCGYQKVLLAPNPTGANDELIHVFKVLGRNGEVEAVLWSYACHPVSFPERTKVGSDFIGVARKALRETWGRDVPVVFYQGFTGNLRPPEITAPRTLKAWMKRVLMGGSFGRWSHQEWSDWADSLAVRVSEIARGSGRPLDQPLEIRRLDRQVSEFLSDAEPDRPFSLHRVSWGGAAALVGVSAEPMTEQGDWIRQASPGGCAVVPVGYIDEVFGYLPTSKIASEGGYEANGFFEYFSIQGEFSRDIDEKFKNLIQKLF